MWLLQATVTFQTTNKHATLVSGDLHCVVLDVMFVERMETMPWEMGVAELKKLLIFVI